MAAKRKKKEFNAEELVAQMQRNSGRMPTKGSEYMRKRKKK